MLAQVTGCAGAGVEKEVEPAPREGMGARFMAQVPCQKPHLRQYGVPPVPKKHLTCAKLGLSPTKNLTCTNTVSHLRQYSVPPAPKQHLTCAKIGLHLRQKL